VIVSDQGETEETAALMAEYSDNPLVIHLKSKATSLRENWAAGANYAIDQGFEFFAWLQDDDEIHYRYADRICESFDKCPQAIAWAARLECADGKGNALWFSSNGPMVPMRRLENGHALVPGELMGPVAYVTSWCLSPGAAFRCGEDFRKAVAEQPDGVDLYTERTIFASIGQYGKVLCDPVTVGYWNHHGKNESYRQREKQKEQTEIFVKWMDSKMDDIDGWEEPFNEWCRWMPSTFLLAFLQGMEHMTNSRWLPEIRRIMIENMSDLNPPSMGPQQVDGVLAGGEALGLPDTTVINQTVQALVV
jgi:hypothetical protein